MNNRIRPQVALALCFLLSSLPASAARLTLSGYADTNLDPAPPNGFSFDEDPATVGSLLGTGVQQQGGSFGPQVRGESSGHATLGRLGVAALAEANGPAPTTSLFVMGEAGAAASWSDSFRIVPSDNALLGTRMRFRFRSLFTSPVVVTSFRTQMARSQMSPVSLPIERGTRREQLRGLRFGCLGSVELQRTRGQYCHDIRWRCARPPWHRTRWLRRNRIRQCHWFGRDAGCNGRRR